MPRELSERVLRVYEDRELTPLRLVLLSYEERVVLESLRLSLPIFLLLRLLWYLLEPLDKSETLLSSSLGSLLETLDSSFLDRDDVILGMLFNY